MRKVKRAWACVSHADTLLGIGGVSISALVSGGVGGVMTVYEISPLVFTVIMVVTAGMSTTAALLYINHRLRMRYEAREKERTVEQRAGSLLDKLESEQAQDGIRELLGEHRELLMKITGLLQSHDARLQKLEGGD